MEKEIYVRKGLNQDRHYSQSQFDFSFSKNGVQLKGSNLLVVLSTEGGLPIYTRSIHVDKFGRIHNIKRELFEPNSEPIMLMSGLIEAISQLKEVVRPTLVEITEETDHPIFVDYTKTQNGMALITLSTSSEFQNLSKTLLSQHLPMLDDLKGSLNLWENGFDQILEDRSLADDSTIYKRILGQIKKDLGGLISFILVYDDKGEFLFSTSRNQDNPLISDSIIPTISRFVKYEYIFHKRPDSILGAKQLKDSVIWHFKCYNRIFVFLTYRVPDMHTFCTIKSEMITFISNNLEKFIEACNWHDKEFHLNKALQSSRFVFLS
ncbi:hypothetical protein [Candidatus Hodarchaeum mangrovi]